MSRKRKRQHIPDSRAIRDKEELRAAIQNANQQPSTAENQPTAITKKPISYEQSS